VFSQPFFCSNVKETSFFLLHIVTAGTVQLVNVFLLIKNVGKIKKNVKNAFFILKYKKTLKTFFYIYGLNNDIS